MLLHGRGYPTTSRRAEARDCRNPAAKSSLLTNAHTTLYGDKRSDEARTEIEGNHGRIKVHD